MHFGDDAAARALARRVNESLAEIKLDRPDRFGGFASLPLPDVEGSLVELEYALDVLELDGVSLMSNAGDRYLGDSHFDALFAEMQRRAAVVFVHPTASPDPIAHTLGLRTHSSTIRLTRRERSRSCITATRSPGHRTSSTCSRTPAARSRSSHPASRSSMR
ncbi:MAG: amidohydrolase family protein [Solirubrobacteraceae bacterium]